MSNYWNEHVVSGVAVTVVGMSTLICPHGCGDLSVFIARRGRRQRPYIGCRHCGYSEWRGGNPATDMCCADSIPTEHPQPEPETIDVVEGMDPYAD